MKVSTVVVLVSLCAASTASAQLVGPVGTLDVPASPAAAPVIAPDATSLDPAPALEPVNPSLFKSIGHDFTGFFSTDTAKILGAFTVAGLAARPADHASVEDTSERISSGAARVGNIGGGVAIQAGGAFAAYAIGRATGRPEMASLGGELLRAQLLTQAFVQGTKFVVGRQRPDGSNNLSFPSGHTASAFATATVIEQHYGWKAGVPAYALAGFVGASRLASQQHYLTDVLIGAGIGIAAGRTVSLHVGREKFALGAAPTQGGAVVTFTRH